MKIFSTTLFTFLIVQASFAQVETQETEEEVTIEEVQVEEVELKKDPDTTRLNLGKTEVIIIDKKEKSEDNEFEDDFNEDGEDHHKKNHNKKEAHWAGIDFGFTLLMNDNFENKFENYPYFQNDAARSQVWNLNLLEHKFGIAGNYFGLTTGLGFSFTSVAFKDNYVLSYDADTLTAQIDSVYSYSKNKLKATYLTMPLLLEFNTSSDPNKSFYLATGVVGGVRIASKVKTVGEFDGKEFKQKRKGTYGLNSFKLDATARLGYKDFGVFASYSLLPLFDKGVTTEAYPLSFGLSLNF